MKEWKLDEQKCSDNFTQPGFKLKSSDSNLKQKCYAASN